MTEPADQVISALRTGHDRLAAFVRGLAPEDLTGPSGASEWDLSQVLSHLGSGAEIGLALLRGSLDGTGTPDGDFNKSVWARWDASSPAERAAGFLTADEALVAAYEALDAKTREELRIDFGFLPAPVDVATAARLRLSEFAFHAWDVRVASDPAARLDPEAVPLLLDIVPMFIGFSARAEAVKDRPARLALRLSAPDTVLGLDLGETVAVTEEPALPDGVLTAPTEWWLRLAFGRHAPEHTPATVELSGDSITLDDLRRVFPGF